MIRKRGFAIPLVFIVVIIAILLGLMRMFISRQHYSMMNHVAEYEKAYFLAQTGLKAAKSRFRAMVRYMNHSNPTTFPKNEKAPDDLKPFIQALFGKYAIPAGAEVECKLDSEMLRYALDNFDDAEEIEIRLLLKNKGPVYSSDSINCGYRVDPNEADWIVRVECRARVGKANCWAYQYKEIRIVNITPPVIGKFAVFLHEQDGLAPLNRIQDSNNPAKFNDAPMIIYPGPKDMVAQYGFLPLKGAWDYFDRVGWIYLGGATPWHFNLTHGGSNPDFQEGYLSGLEYCYPPGPESADFYDNRNMNWISSQSCLFKELGQWKTYYEALAKVPADSYSLTSVLNLWGNNRFPNPTLVVGQASRNWCLLQGIRLTDESNAIRGVTHCTLPYLDAPLYESGSNWPGFGIKREDRNAIDILRANLSSYDQYQSRMSQLVREDYNRGLLNYIELPLVDRQRQLLVNTAALSPTVKDLLISRRLSVDGSPARFYEQAAGQSYTIKNDAGETMFQGNLDQIRDFRFLLPKSGVLITKGDQFFDQIGRDANGDVYLGGIVRVGSDLNIDRVMTIAPGGGGILLVEGNVKISRKIRLRNFEPLTIVALGQHNITVTTQQLIQAGLVSLDGKVILPDRFTIEGFIAARQLLPEGFSGKRVRVVRYGPQFDPTSSELYARNYRIMNQYEWISYVR